MTLHSEISPQVSAAIEHSKTNFPHNFRLAETVSVSPVGDGFLRVRVCAPDMSGFAADSLHFRLVLPNTHCAEPVWPSAGENGKTIWPEGEHALHKPVYTVRAVDVDQGWMEFDVFVHDGGRVTAWAQALSAGQAVGLIGPLGGGIPVAPDILLAGDETAFPAIARILEAPNRPKTGEVFLLSDVKDYDFVTPDGYVLHWVSPVLGEQAFIDQIASTARCADSYIWFGGEKSVAQAMRAHFRDTCGVGTDMSYFSGYWRR